MFFDRCGFTRNLEHSMEKILKRLDLANVFLFSGLFDNSDVAPPFLLEVVSQGASSEAASFGMLVKIAVC